MKQLIFEIVQEVANVVGSRSLDTIKFFLNIFYFAEDIAKDLLVPLGSLKQKRGDNLV